MKIGIVGYGYWGKILHKTIQKITNSSDILIHDPANNNIGLYNLLDRDYIFVAVPVSEHYNVCKYFLNKGISIFCEKPLADTTSQCLELYNLAKNNNAKLFVDWLFIYNDQVNYVKQLFNLYGEPSAITMKRLNKGPVRYDTPAFRDLLSHDISILTHLFDKKIDISNVHNYKLNKESVQNDSCYCTGHVNNTLFSLEGSWEYPIKNRDCYFIFEKANKLVYWNDIEQTVKIITLNNIESIDKAENWNYKTSSYPLDNSIKTFLYEEDFSYNKKVTINTMEVLINEV